MPRRIFPLFIAAAALALTAAGATSAPAPTYPIAELENCRDARECYFYCEIPRHNAACWSYQEFIGVPQALSAEAFGVGRVLGQHDESPEETARRLGITFPIAELGNCSSPNECKSHCDNPQNHEACLTFAQAHGLEPPDEQDGDDDILQYAQAELGCSSRQACEAFCSQAANQTKCQAFTEKYLPDQAGGGPNQDIMRHAQAELGCGSRQACEAFCSNPTNGAKCQAFMEKYLPDEAAKHQRPGGDDVMAKAQSILGCSSQAECETICKQPANHDKCAAFARANIPDYQERNEPPGGRGIPADFPCQTKEECEAFCSNPANGEKCSQLGGPGGGQPPPGIAPKDGPRPDCQTEAECRQYCAGNPNQCPGFPEGNKFRGPGDRGFPDGPQPGDPPDDDPRFRPDDSDQPDPYDDGNYQSSETEHEEKLEEHSSSSGNFEPPPDQVAPPSGDTGSQ